MRKACWGLCPVRQSSKTHNRIQGSPLTRTHRERAFCCSAVTSTPAKDKYMTAVETPVIDFEKAGGLVAGIVQDQKTGEVLMLGFLNEASYAKTLESGFVTFWSRTRGKLWMKGETSGNRLRVVSAATDCDNDALLFRVDVDGDGLVCHEGTVSCFTKPIV
jgi:phosphoribosyl-AMP cyclohydrolase